jgi:tetrahydromethanopterin S-methyltransferase subunit H
MSNRIIYNVQDVLVGPGNQSDAVLCFNKHVLQRVQRVNAVDYAFNVNRRQILQLGTNAVISNAIVDPPSVQLTLNYLSHNVSNEAKIRF